MSALRPDPETRFTCSRCADCCAGPMDVLMRPEDAEAIRGLPLQEIGRDASAVQSAGGGLFKLAKQSGSQRCVMLDDDQLCALHKAFGEASKPTACKRFPYLTVASDEHVWATVNFGCKAAREHSGAPMQAQGEALSQLFSRELSEADPGADTRYPMGVGPDGHTVELRTPQLDAKLDALFEAMGQELFGAMRQLAAFVGVCHEADEMGRIEGSLGEPEAPRRQPPTRATVSVRHAFALTLYSDLLDPFSMVDRVRGVWALPKLLSFDHSYPSRLLNKTVHMRQVAHHPGNIPLKAELTLLRLIRSRLRSRLVFQHAEHAAMGITRLLLQVNAALYLARAQAVDRPITDDEVLRAIELVEVHIAHQLTSNDLARVDPRLRAAWNDPEVARGVAQLFTPSGVWSAHSVTVQV